MKIDPDETLIIIETIANASIQEIADLRDIFDSSCNDSDQTPSVLRMYRRMAKMLDVTILEHEDMMAAIEGGD